MKEEKIKIPAAKEKYIFPSSPTTSISAQHQLTGGDEEQQQLLPRRPLCTSFGAISCLFGAFLVLASIAVLLALSLTSLHDPTITLASARVLLASSSPSPSPPSSTNATTLGLDLLVCNPNGAAAFDHGPGTTLLRYRGHPLGSVEASAGSVPAKGCEHVRCGMALDGLFGSAGRHPAAAGHGPGAGGVGGLLGRIIDDAAQHDGEVPFDAQSRLQGTVRVLGIFRRKAVAAGTCHVVMKLSIAAISVKRYSCTPAPDP